MIREDIAEKLFEIELIRNSIRRYLQDADIEAYNRANDDIDAIHKQIEIIKRNSND